MHDVIVVGIPLIAILAGILFNRNDVKGLRDEIRGDLKGLRSEFRGDIAELRSEMRAGFARIDADLRQFYHVTGKLEDALTR